MFIKVIDVKDYPTGRLRLIKPSLKHAAPSLVWLRDPEVGQFMGADFSNVSTETETKRIEDLLEDQDTYTWMIELDGTVIGNVEINAIKKTSEKYGEKAAKFSTLIGDKTQWGKRIAPSVKRAVMDWAFREGGFALFVGRVAPANERSWRSLEHLGFERADDEKEVTDGKSVTWKIYLMTKQRWRDLQTP